MLETSHIFEKMHKEFEERMIQKLDIERRIRTRLLNRLPSPKTVLDVKLKK